MALKRDVRYPARYSAASSGQPQGAFKNRSAPGASDGSYLEADWLNDWSAFFSSLLIGAGTTINGNVDAVGACQTYDALLGLIATPKTFSLNDFVRIPNKPGGLILQWGVSTTSSGGLVTITYPTIFPTRTAAFVATGNGGNNTLIANIGSPSSCTVQSVVSNTSAPSSTVSFSWFAIGY